MRHDRRPLASEVEAKKTQNQITSNIPCEVHVIGYYSFLLAFFQGRIQILKAGRRGRSEFEDLGFRMTCRIPIALSS